MPISIAEDLSLREWRKLFLEIHTKKGKDKLEKVIWHSLDPLREGMLPWETAYLHIKNNGSFEAEFPIPVPLEEMDPEFEIF